jgi:hypothetical protein
MSGNVILVAHKCLDYDAKVLLRNLEEFEIPYEETILGFSDSLLASRYLRRNAVLPPAQVVTSSLNCFEKSKMKLLWW